jgi:hypothetical protein
MLYAEGGYFYSILSSFKANCELTLIVLESFVLEESFLEESYYNNVSNLDVVEFDSFLTSPVFAPIFVLKTLFLNWFPLSSTGFYFPLYTFIISIFAF